MKVYLSDRHLYWHATYGPPPSWQNLGKENCMWQITTPFAIAMGMTYLPKPFQYENLDTIVKIINQYPFVIIASQQPTGEPFFNHLPVQVKRKGK